MSSTVIKYYIKFMGIVVIPVLPEWSVRRCNGWWGGGVCGSWGKRCHLGSRGAWPARRGKQLAVSFGQRRRGYIARWPKTQETGTPHLQETFMNRVSAIVHCTAVIWYNHNRNLVSLYYHYLFQENKSFCTDHHLHSSSDVREVVSSTGGVNPSPGKYVTVLTI